MRALIIAANCFDLIMFAVLAQSDSLTPTALIVLVFAGACALVAGLINS